MLKMSFINCHRVCERLIINQLGIKNDFTKYSETCCKCSEKHFCFLLDIFRHDCLLADMNITGSKCHQLSGTNVNDTIICHLKKTRLIEKVLRNRGDLSSNTMIGV